MEKFPEAYEIVKNQVTVLPPIELNRTDLERAHTKAYLDAVSQDDPRSLPFGLTTYDRNRLGLPANPRLLERSALETAGTVSATLAALEDGLAANLAGGTHHAFPDRGLGFCVLNDIAVTIEYLRAHDCCPSQILIVDTDAHQGNANHAYFRNDPTVFTYSIHVGKNYPAHKEPGDYDVPLTRWVEDDQYLDALQTTLPEVFKQIEPDLVFWITGADNHFDDRFGQMRLSQEAMTERDEYILQLCHDYSCTTGMTGNSGGGTVMVYGGGYNRKPGMTGALHARTIRTASKAIQSA